MRINERVLYQEIGRRIRERRLQAGMTQQGLGEAIGLLRTSVVNIEAGRQKAPLHVLYAVSAMLHAEPHELLPSHQELNRPEAVRVQIGNETKEIPARAAELLSRLLEHAPERPR